MTWKKMGRSVAPAIFLAALASLFCGSDDRPAPRRAAGGPLRIVSLSPNVTEILYRLGAGDKVAGVTDFCRYPAEAAAKPKLGGLLNPSVEKIFALEPDLVILLAAHGSLPEKFAARGIRSLLVRNDTIGDVLDSIGRIGAEVNREAAAAALADSIRAIMTGVEGDRPARRWRTMLVVSRTPGGLRDIYVAGPETYLDELLRAAGGVNVFSRTAARYPEPGIEEMVHKNPEVIVEIRPKGMGGGEEEKLAREAWGKLPGIDASARGNIFVIAGDELVVPGPRLGGALRKLAAALKEAR